MKNFCFILITAALLLACIPARAEAIFRYIDLKESTGITLGADGTKTVSADGGISFVSTFLKLRAFESLPETSFSMIKNTRTKDALTLLDSPRYGAELSLFETIPVSLKAGHLTFARSLSKLKSPAPASAASLTASFSTQTGLYPTLPTISSSSQVRSAALSVSQRSRFRLWSFEAAASENELFAVHAGASFRTAPTPQNPSLPLALSASVTLASAPLENTSSTLTQAGGAFEPVRALASALEASACVPFFKSALTLGIFQNPYGSSALTVRTRFRFIKGSFLIDGTWFAIPTAPSNPRTAPLVTLSSDICRTVQVISFNPQYLLYLGEKSGATLRTGAFIQYQEKVLSDRYASVAELLKAGIGIKAESPTLSSTLECSAVNIPLSVTSPAVPSALSSRYFDASLSVHAHLEKATPSFTFGAKHYPARQKLRTIDEKTEYSCALAGTAGAKKAISFRSSYSVTVKNRERTSETFSTSVTVRLKSKHLRTTIKTALILPLR